MHFYVVVGDVAVKMHTGGEHTVEHLIEHVERKWAEYTGQFLRIDAISSPWLLAQGAVYNRWDRLWDIVGGYHPTLIAIVGAAGFGWEYYGPRVEYIDMRNPMFFNTFRILE